MKIDFKALAAGLIVAIVVSLIARAHPEAAKEKPVGVSGFSGDAAVRRG
jgi:hypothetical protein